MRRDRNILPFLVLVGISLASLPQAAGAISDPVTRVEVTSIGTVGALNPAALSPGRIIVSGGAVFAEFPVVSVSGDQILHNGGLTFSSGSDSLELGNFLIDLGQGQLFSQVGGVGASDFPLFNIAPSAVSDAELQLTPEAIAALDATFGVLLPNDFAFGEATVATTPIPEPSAAVLFAAGILLAASRRTQGSRRSAPLDVR
ncbi:MAG: hypothetical protein HKP27_01345 [Myxococcales bacterium]|nr:hypothetical protein [Myxococcales bacterium]